MALPAEVTATTGRFLERIDAGTPGLVTGLYLRGSLAFGEYFPGQSDVDFTAVLAERPGAAELAALASAHAAVHDARKCWVLATGELTSKSGAGRCALTAFGPRWQPIVGEALRVRERPADASEYEHDAVSRGRDTREFLGMAIESGLALRPP